MPLSLPAINAAIVCEGSELETYDVTQEGTSSLTAFIASEAGKGFKITLSNNLTSSDVCIHLHIDGQLVRSKYLYAGKSDEILGSYNSEYSILSFKFQELQLVDSDSEDAPAAPEMGTIELKAYRCQSRRRVKKPSMTFKPNLHCGRVSERSKKAGWHHIATGDEIPVKKRTSKYSLSVHYLDPWDGPPYASIKIFYRPRELLRAQGIIPVNNEGRKENLTKNRKHARESGSPGPSRRRPKIAVKSEELSEDMATQRIQILQAELEVLKAAVQSGTFVKCELRSPSPIIVKHSGEVVDLTLDD